MPNDDVIKWKHFPRYWPFVQGIPQSPVNSPHKGQQRGALMFSLICVWLNGWVNNRKASDLRRHHAHYDVTVMTYAGRNAYPLVLQDPLDLPRVCMPWFHRSSVHQYEASRWTVCDQWLPQHIAESPLHQQKYHRCKRRKGYMQQFRERVHC